jgi:phosphotransferase system  glucose/maltose/N-acetylglucosamine-specific IIC component
MKKLFPAIQKLGKSLMLPIAVLPVAGLLLRLGQPDLLDLPYVAAAGNAVFANLGLLFAIGVAVGLARGSNGAAGLAAVVAYLVTTEGAKVLIDVPPEVIADAAERTAQLLSADYKSAAIMKMSVPAGLISGILAGNLYNRYSEIRLPDYLAFFSGRRFVPIVSGFAALLIAALFGFGWPILETGMNALSEAVIGAGEVGLFGYGLLNRILIVTGLHHILNNLAWFIVGDFEGVTGDLRRYFAGDDVWVACCVPRNVPVGETGTAQGRRWFARVDGIDIIPDRHNRAHRIHIHVRCAGAFCHSRGVDGPINGGDGHAPDPAGIRVFCRPLRLCPEFQQGDPAAPDAAHRGDLFHCLLCDLPVFHRALRRQDARKGRCRAGAGGCGDRRAKRGGREVPRSPRRCPESAYHRCLHDTSETEYCVT